MRRRRTQTAIRLATLALVLIALVPVAFPTGSDGAIDAMEHQPVGGIDNGDTATQQFPAHGAAIHTITVYLATFGRVNHGTLHVSVFAETAQGAWERRATRDLDEAALQDNSYTSLVFSPPLPVTPGKGVRLVMEASAPATDAITWWTNPRWAEPGYQLTYDMQPVPGAAVFEVHYTREARPLILALGALWPRLTTFLTPLWGGVLLIAAIASLISVMLIFRPMPEDDIVPHPAPGEPG